MTRIRRTRRVLGQYFLVNDDITRKLVEYAEVGPTDIVLEVGAGTGRLTQALVSRGCRIIAVEKDHRLAVALRKKFGGDRNVFIIEGDVRYVPLPEFNKVVSTPPYYISSSLLLLLSKVEFKLGVLVLQKEFVQRMTAESGSSDYGRLTVMVSRRFDVEMLDPVSRKAFKPSPRVDSAIVRLVPRETAHGGEEAFSDLVRGLFVQRRRILRGALRHYIQKNYGEWACQLFSKITLPEKRVYQLTVQEFEELSRTVLRTLMNHES